MVWSGSWLVSGVLAPVVAVFGVVVAPVMGAGGLGGWLRTRLVRRVGPRRWGMGKGWFMGVPGWVWDWPGGGLVRLVGWCRGLPVRGGPRRCGCSSWGGGLVGFVRGCVRRLPMRTRRGCGRRGRGCYRPRVGSSEIPVNRPSNVRFVGIVHGTVPVNWQYLY